MSSLARTHARASGRWSRPAAPSPRRLGSALWRAALAAGAVALATLALPVVAALLA